jgi:hypothetical protein
MNETEAPLSILQQITALREGTKLSEIPLSALQKLSGSIDSARAADAQEALIHKWYQMKPEHASENVPSVDLVEIFESFTAEQQKYLLQNLQVLALNDGCNSHCNFCMYGPNPGVTRKFSFASIARFFEMHGDKFADNQIYLYGFSDPFDYADKVDNTVYTFTDVYKEYRKKGKGFQYISTAIPPGSVDRFITFVTYLAQEQTQIAEITTNIRISVTDYNADRVEAALKLVTENLRQSGMAEVAINDFLKKVISLDNRTNGNYYHIGKFIERDPRKAKLDSSAGSDGMAITPHGCESHILVAPTPYTPSGYLITPYTTESNLSGIVQPTFLRPYTQQKSVAEFAAVIVGDNRLLPNPRTITIGGFVVPEDESDAYENSYFTISRHCLAIYHALHALSVAYKEQSWQSLSEHMRQKYFKEMSWNLITASSNMTLEIDRIKSALTKKTRPIDQDKAEYFVNLGTFYREKINIVTVIIKALLSQEEKNQHLFEVASNMIGAVFDLTDKVPTIEEFLAMN